MSARDEPAPAWQNNAPFHFFASLQLAMLLMGVLIIASVAGTIYESSFDAKVARAYIYGAKWFNLWLLLLAINLICSALSRMPWKKHHTGFLVTHLGIIVLLLGSVIGRIWGVEGTMTLFKDEPASSFLTIDERVLQIVENDKTAQLIPLEFINRRPSPQSPRHLTATPSGWSFDAVDYSTTLQTKTEATASGNDGPPAIHVKLSTQKMGQNLDAWLLADETHSTFDLGLAQVTFARGIAPSAKADDPVEIEESIFAFANSPADQIAKSLKGGSTGAKVALQDGQVSIMINEVLHTYLLAGNVGKEMPVEQTPFRVRIEQYWPDFRVKDGKPTTLGDEPNNPCVLVTLRGWGIPVASLSEGGAGKNMVTIYLADDGSLSYQLSSRKSGISSGALTLAVPLATGWADWQLTVDQSLPHAAASFVARPAPNGSGEGVLVRATRAAERRELWAPFGWQVSLPTETGAIRLGYGFRQQPLPIGLKLQEFEVERNEGTDSAAGFKSTLQISGMDGRSVTGQCWMNNPISYPSSWINTFSGLTYKISQASWNPENLSQSTVQILRDPGWGLKWLGSLLIVFGVFSLFYLRPYPHDLVPPPEVAASAPVPSRQTVEV